jgi:hypothetical protein
VDEVVVDEVAVGEVSWARWSCSRPTWVCHRCCARRTRGLPQSRSSYDSRGASCRQSRCEVGSTGDARIWVPVNPSASSVRARPARRCAHPSRLAPRGSWRRGGRPRGRRLCRTR